MEVATAVLSPLLESLTKKLGSTVWKEVGLLWGVKDDIQELQQLLSTINAVLEDAERRSINDVALREWLMNLKDVAFDADDVVDEFQTQELRRRMDIGNPLIRKVCLFFSYPECIFTRVKVAHKIKNILKKFDKLAKERHAFHLAEGSSPVSHLDRETHSRISDEIFGREDDKRKVVKWLIDVDNDKDVAILPIVGLGGLGKTTLAQSVFNDEELEGHFDIKKWVWVERNFDVKEILKAIIGTDEINQMTNLEKMQKKLQEEFLNKKYLLILDDVWNDDTLKWDRLKNLLRGSLHGNKIIVTTRSLEVARIMGTVSEPHKLEVLSDDDCWKLFEQRAFGLQSPSETPKLVEIGHEIVKKCGGLPLAAKSIGSLMATKQGEDKWLDVKNSKIWVENSQEGILPALLISFDDLSPQLKQCFAYCAMFPKDFRMNKLVLIQLWIAGGFVEYLQDKCLEDIGEGYFDILWSRSFFQEENRDRFGKIVSCKMHDLVHDLACSVSKDESSTLGSSWNSYRKCRHLSLSCRSTTVDLQTVANDGRKLRSLFLFENEYWYETSIEKDVEFAIPNLTRLRALYAAHYIGSRNALSGIGKLIHLRFLAPYIGSRNALSGIGKLKHLRFLDLSNSNIDSLPDSITNLYNLQTLLLKDCHNLEDLPKGMKKMVNLRHLDLEGCFKLTTMPSGLSRLTNLQTLTLFKVGNKEAGHLSLVELQPLKQIRGSLKISGFDNVQDPTDATKAELKTKKDIQGLSLNYENVVDDDDDVTVNVLENLQPHPNLKTLQILGYGGSRLPNWLGSATALEKLVKLTLNDLSRCKSLPSLGQLPGLKELNIYMMRGLEKIGPELLGSLSSTGGIIGGTTFPLLKSLTLSYMPLLKEWSIPKCDQGEGEVLFPSLETLEIRSCPILRIQPSLPSSILKLTISKCNQELLAAGGCLKGLFKLRKLTIYSMEASKTAGGWEGLQYLTNLEELYIVGCFNLRCLPEEIMQHSFPFLRTLRLASISDIVSIGMEEQQQQEPPPLFMSLHHLQIYSCHELRVLPGWLRGLTSLQSLTLDCCSKLEMLPDGLQHLTDLKQLIIKQCLILQERCKRDVGEDWHKISHIPRLDILE